MNIPHRLAVQAAAESDPARVFAMIDAELRHALELLTQGEPATRSRKTRRPDRAERRRLGRRGAPRRGGECLRRTERTPSSKANFCAPGFGIFLRVQVSGRGGYHPSVCPPSGAALALAGGVCSGVTFDLSGPAA